MNYKIIVKENKLFLLNLESKKEYEILEDSYEKIFDKFGMLKVLSEEIFLDDGFEIKKINEEFKIKI